MALFCDFLDLYFLFLWPRIGGERVVFIAAAFWGLITAATPLLASLGTHVLVLMTFSRFLMGVTQGSAADL